MIPEIVQHGEEVLRRKIDPVPSDEIGGAHLAHVISSMKAALAETPDGVAIAAPQIGEPLRIFVVSGHVYDRLSSASQQANPTEETASSSDEKQEHPDKVFINPEIIKRSKETADMEEGCLSVRNYFGTITRHTKVTVSALDENGNEFTEGRSGLLAQIFQHEIDHLNGILFIDNAKDVVYRDPEETDNE